MFKIIMCAATVAGAMACDGQVAGPDIERPAPADRFIITTQAGSRFAGSSARVDIRYSDGERPDVEISFSASDRVGREWAVTAAAPAAFLRTLSMSAPLVNRPLALGDASVQLRSASEEPSFAGGGRIELHLNAGQLTGETSGVAGDFAAKFQGPFVVTCAVPAGSLSTGAPSAASENALPALIVDEKFESPLCKPYATLARTLR